MTLYDLVNTITIQGNVEVIVFHADGHQSTHHFRDCEDLSTRSLAGIEDMEVTFLYPSHFPDSEDWTTIELAEEVEV